MARKPQFCFFAAARMALAALIACSVSSCSWLTSSTNGAQTEHAEPISGDAAAGSTAPSIPPAQEPAIELRWVVPRTKDVEKYHLRYGSDPANLDHKLEIPVSQLQLLDDPVHGSLYQFVLTGIPAGQPVFYSIQAENKFGLSPETPAQQAE